MYFLLSLEHHTPMTEFTYENSIKMSLTVGLGDTLDLILLLDGVTVGRAAGSVDDLIGQALSNSLDVSERRLSGTGGHQVDSLVHSAEGRHIHSLSSNNTGRADSGGVLTGTRVDDGIHVHLNGVLVGQDVNQLQSVSHDAESQQLLSVVSAGAHQGAHQALHDGALLELKVAVVSTRASGQQSKAKAYVSLLEASSLVSAGSVGDEGGVLALDGKEILVTGSASTS